jgi:hypothetical protein
MCQLMVCIQSHMVHVDAICAVAHLNFGVRASMGCRTFTGQIVEIWSPFPVTIHSTS